jgi:plastocyanin
MAWLTFLFSALLATLTPTHAAPPHSSAHRWTVIVGGATADTAIYANAFFPKAIEIGVGDTITWQFEGFHNVAFLGGGATPPFSVQDSGKFYFNPLVAFPAGDNGYDGTGYHNSGLPGPDGKLSYTLTFKKPGRYPYLCAIHEGMRAMVIVTDKPRGTPAAALQRGRAEQAATLAAGRRAFANLRVERHGTTFVVPLLGNSQDRYSVLRFTREPLVVPRGSTVTWAMRDTFEVHTVTFTSGEKPPPFVVPQPQAGGPPKLLLNPRAVTPTATTQYDGTGYVNSGMIFPPGNPAKLPSSYSLTFTTPGRFEYWCLIHADVGQRGTIVVQ